MDEAYAWAAEQFGAAKLGDVRRTVRLVELAAACAERPGGRVTRVSRSSASREAAYRFLESRLVDDSAVAVPMFAATARRCSGSAQVIVAVDQSTTSFVDRKKSKQLGRTGSVSLNFIRRGFEVMTALAVLPNGQTTGVLAQEWHVRREELVPSGQHDDRPVQERESVLWSRCMNTLVDVLREHAPNTKPWLQMDRGADIGHVLRSVSSLDVDFTIRSNQNRALQPNGYLRDAVGSSAPLGTVVIKIPVAEPASRGPRTRIAKFTVRAKRLQLRLQDSHDRSAETFPITVVQIREAGGRQADPIEWFLLTNRRADSLQQAMEVVKAYRYRWRIEEFHHAWKSGVCDLEGSQLRSAHALRRWATILAAVATRAEQLKTSSRATPDVPATIALSRDEIDTAIILSETPRYKLGDTPTLEQAVELIALIGGYTGRRNSGGPPGAIIIARGLVDVTVGARARARSG